MHIMQRNLVPLYKGRQMQWLCISFEKLAYVNEQNL
jgi:hypothetical protein